MSLRTPSEDDPNFDETEGHAESNNKVIRRGLYVLLGFLIIAVAVTIARLSVYIGAYYRFSTASPSADGIQDFLPHTLISQADGGDALHGLSSLEPFVSFEAINRFVMQDPKRQAHTETPESVLSQIKSWIAGLGRLVPYNAIFTQDPDRRVHPGTRERVLSQITAWIDSPNATERILWIHGPAGIGKSTIAQTIVHSYTTDKVPANFFFRSHSDRDNGNRLFTTLAWQFASSIPGFKAHVARSLIEQPDLPTKSVEIQFQELIVRPFEALSNDTRQPPLSDMVVVIKGVDGCMDEEIQERILTLIGNIATNIHVPLRFLISSRPEARTQKTMNRFERHTLSIDLAKCADTDRDIEIYLKDRFDNIAKDQRIDPAIWPSPEMIQRLVAKASGHFLYASTVIKFVGDRDNNAKTQLDVVLASKPRTTILPFSELDGLYIAILERQQDQEFLKTFLASLVAENSLSIFRPFSHRAACSYPYLRDGYGILMNVSEQDLRNKLHQMRTLLRIAPDFIGVHHRSFLDFLQDPYRSGEYHISTVSAAKQHLMLIIDSLVQSTSNSSESLAIQPDYNPPVPELVEMFGTYPSPFDKVLSREDWRKALQPLLNVRDRIFNWTDFTIPPNECTIFHLVHRVLLSISYRQLFLDKPEKNDAVMSSVLKPNPPGGIFSLPTYFRTLKGTVDLMHTLLHVDTETIVMRMRSWSEAQNLMDLVCHIVNGKYLITSFFSADVARKATQLALEIHTKVPVLPQFFLSTTYTSGPYFELGKCWSCDIGALGRAWLISNILDHRYTFPLLLKTSRTNMTSDHLTPAITLMSGNVGIPLSNWREVKNPGSNAIISVMLELARAIQYLHSFGIVLFENIGPDDIYVDPKSHVRISPLQLVWSVQGQPLQEEAQTRYENSVYKFGYLFCTIHFDTKLPCTTASPSKLKSSVYGDVWHLVQRCLSAEDKPSIDDVVQEMESWRV